MHLGCKAESAHFIGHACADLGREIRIVDQRIAFGKIDADDDAAAAPTCACCK